MKLYPAVDILAGNAVRLVQGDFGRSRTYDQDPLAAAQAWVAAGAERLHVVDLDGARSGEPVNLEHLRRIASEAGVAVQFGGGLRTPETVRAALAAGASRVILGTAAFEAPELLEAALAEHGAARIAVAVDVRGGFLATHGWVRTTQEPAREAFARLREQGVSDFVFTNIDQDGMLSGANRDEVTWVAAAAGDGSVIFSGGIGSLEDLRELVRLRREQALERLEGVIVGTALYEHRFTVPEALAALAD